MNFKRILTGLIGFPIVVAALIFGNKYIIDALFAIIALISMYEYLSAVEKEYKPTKFLRIYFSSKYSLYTYNSFKSYSTYSNIDNANYNNDTIYKCNNYKDEDRV